MSEILPLDRKNYLIRAILPRLQRDKLVDLELTHMVVK